MKNSTLAIPILLLVTGFLLFVIVFNGVISASHADLKALIETTTATFGTLLGIITAGLMFTQGKYGELTGELGEKSPHYLRDVLSLQELRSMGENLRVLTKVFNKLADDAEVLEEKELYRRIVDGSSSMFINIAVLLNLKLKHERLIGTGLLISDMSQKEHQNYQKKSRNLRKDWHLFGLIKQTIDTWESPTVIQTSKTSSTSSLRFDVASTIPLLRLKEEVKKGSEKFHLEVERTLRELDGKIDKIALQFHEDRIPQLLTQMEQASIIRGKYFYLCLLFIATPLLVNLLILPQFSEATSIFLKEIVALTSVLAVLGVVILLFYIRKMLNV